jgi:hypothetical protein
MAHEGNGHSNPSTEEHEDFFRNNIDTPTHDMKIQKKIEEKIEHEE